MNTTQPGQSGQSGQIIPSYYSHNNVLGVNTWLLTAIRVLFGAVLGGIGGAVVGTKAGWAAGPIGAIAGGSMGAVMGFFGAGVAVALIALFRQRTAARTPVHNS
ncbi:MAG: hypothetical protein V4671_33580 [Armatimonadota bacterium]